jgi:hypothetical protein
MSILRCHGQRAQIMGRVKDHSKAAYLRRARLVGHGKQFEEQ